MQCPLTAYTFLTKYSAPLNDFFTFFSQNAVPPMQCPLTVFHTFLTTQGMGNGGMEEWGNGDHLCRIFVTFVEPDFCHLCRASKSDVAASNAAWQNSRKIHTHARTHGHWIK